MEGMETRVLMAVCILLGLVSVGVAAPGSATFYKPHQPSDCHRVKEPGPMVAAASDSLWSNGAICGKKFNVTCLGPPSTGEKFPCKGSVIVTVVDRCASPRCETTLELSRPAFNKIVNPKLVKIIIDYKMV
ncbi:hypothetical protein BT93_L3414 [Corymbia citriodora subsp. variegata]|uniref:Expansin-like EG45 domain-containing protein n=1 Tax=Corymbia citriodora subsp. variegata TaxID=360336 RepID=A0A8T0CHN4_CORYI|nr:hypothetical protein BT93_L3414 [Corymbia citriodora subsp. variegata]